MITNFLSQIQNIFIGRQAELNTLKDIWDLTQEPREHFVYVLLNAPGIGKTTLIDHFGKIIETNKQGLYIKFVCSNNLVSKNSIHKAILQKIDANLILKQQFIVEIIQKKFKFDQTAGMKKWKNLRENLDKIINKIEYEIQDIVEVLGSISIICPILFAVDETQQFQEIEFPILSKSDHIKKDLQVEIEKETGLHYFSRILKDLLNSQVFLLLSGTKYHILRQIGFKIGSPIKEKVKPLLITKFDEKELILYHKKIEEIIHNAHYDINSPKIKKIHEYFCQFLLAYSGGHARTISILSEIYLTNIDVLISDARYQDYEQFISYLLPRSEDRLNNTLIAAEKQDFLLQLQSNRFFNIVKNWMVIQSTRGLLLGRVPSVNDVNEEVELQNIIYNLMNVGIIVQNGNANYYLTSFFHYKAFLNALQGEFEAFLKEIFRNKYFQLMCGSHAGFGYTFEHIFSTALLKSSQELHISKAKKIVLKPTQIQRMQIISGAPKWKELQFDPDILYYFPQMKAIDFCIIQNRNCIFIQITTSETLSSSKLVDFVAEADKIIKIPAFKQKGWTACTWFISLFPIPPSISIPPAICITADQDLSEILGANLLVRLQEIKNNLP